ncbi:MAG: glycoside hydrolase family protein [Lachnospiraceae bacterium]|nr:glycoside hydrolase family protein [Lachnospiraceae bacterium]
MKTSEAGRKLIQQFEGCRLQAYRDCVGVLTIGYGHTGDVAAGQVITQQRADELMVKDLERFERGVERCVTVPLTQEQFDALVSFSYNLGTGSLQKSTLLRKLNGKDYQGAAQEFVKWNKAGGKVLAGLTRRREAEKAMFLSGKTTAVPKEEKEFETVTITAEVLNIRKGAGVGYPIVGKLQKGMTCTVEKRKNPQEVWGKLTDREGYICMKYTRS